MFNPLAPQLLFLTAPAPGVAAGRFFEPQFPRSFGVGGEEDGANAPRTGRFTEPFTDPPITPLHQSALENLRAHQDKWIKRTSLMLFVLQSLRAKEEGGTPKPVMPERRRRAREALEGIQVGGASIASEAKAVLNDFAGRFFTDETFSDPTGDWLNGIILNADTVSGWTVSVLRLWEQGPVDDGTYRDGVAKINNLHFVLGVSRTDIISPMTPPETTIDSGDFNQAVSLSLWGHVKESIAFAATGDAKVGAVTSIMVLAILGVVLRAGAGTAAVFLEGKKLRRSGAVGTARIAATVAFIGAGGAALRGLGVAFDTAKEKGKQAMRTAGGEAAKGGLSELFK